MNRHPEYKYRVGQINTEEHWINIEDKDDSGWGKLARDPWEDDNERGALEFILRVKDKTGWDIEKVGDWQYRFKQDELGIIYQWDDLFGFVILYKDASVLNKTLEFIESITGTVL